MASLHIAITAHGYGHLAQVAPIAHALAERQPDLRITLHGAIEPAVAVARLPRDFRHLDEAADVALPMDGPLRVRWDEGLARYIAFDAEHERHLERQCALLAQDPPDLLLADVPWMPLLAARELGIPAVALCSLSWLDILAQSPVGAKVPASLIERMRDAYAGAALFLRAQPSMPMTWLPNGHDIGPVARPRTRAKEALCARLGLQPTKRLVLIQFGGAGGLPVGPLAPVPDDLHFLTPDPRIAAGRDEISLIGGPGLSVLDVLASCDAIITKPGYGTFAEAATHGIPVLYVPRPDWPEQPYLVRWLAAHVPTREVSADDLAAGHFAEPLQAILDAAPVTPLPATGVDEAVALLEPFLR